MNSLIGRGATIALIASALGVGACGSGVTNAGTSGNSAVTAMPVTGTIFTIVFENKDESTVYGSQYFTNLAAQNGRASAYVIGTHPSLPNYIMMTSGQTNGIADDADPAAHTVAGTENLGSQLEAAHIPWRAYGENMGTSCNVTSSGLYAVKHMPFAYYTDLTNNAAVCNDRMVDFDQNFEHDLASNQYRYMWITPNMCNDMHDCPVATSEQWLQRVLPMIMNSEGYRNNGAIFILWDEGGGPFGIPSGQANVAGIVISPLTPPGTVSAVRYDHTSYLATVEDILGMPRLPTTANASAMSDFFSGASTTTPTTNTTGTTGTGSTSTGM